MRVLSQEGISPLYSKSCKDSLSWDTSPTHPQPPCMSTRACQEASGNCFLAL